METLSTDKSFGGVQGVYRHHSAVTGCDMTFAVYLPPQAEDGPVPVLWYLSGLTCTHANVMEKGEYRRAAAALGIAVICPDTSPRGTDVPDEPDNWQFGSGAGFYVDATEAPYDINYRMYSYIMEDLSALVAAQFPLRMDRQGIFGHSMGGHGALVIGLRNPQQYVSVSAFSPIANPSDCPWGEKALGGYLGDDKSAWQAYDAAILLAEKQHYIPLLVEQGRADQFLEEQLKPQALINAAQKSDTQLTLNMHEGYDHSYFFIASFIEEHLQFHASHLGIGGL